MKADLSQGFFLKESLLGEVEEAYTADVVEHGNVEDRDRPLLDDQEPESPLLNGPPNPWRHSGLRTQRTQDMTITRMIDGPQNLMSKSLGRGLHRVAERGLDGPDQQGPRDKTNHLVSGD